MDEVEKAQLYRLLTEPEKSSEYAAFIADLLIQNLAEERQKHLLFVTPEIYVTNISPQSTYGRFLVAEYRRDWDESMDDLVGMLTRRGWLADARSPNGVRVPMSMEVDNKVMPLIGYIRPLLNQRDTSDCEVERKQAARCYAIVSLKHDRQGKFTLNSMTIANPDGKIIQLPYQPTPREKSGREQCTRRGNRAGKA